jgi:hypothetical protein
MFNANLSPFLNNTLGIPIILNSTATLTKGVQGLTASDMQQIMPNPDALIPKIIKLVTVGINWITNKWAKP